VDLFDCGWKRVAIPCEFNNVSSGFHRKGGRVYYFADNGLYTALYCETPTVLISLY